MRLYKERYVMSKEELAKNLRKIRDNNNITQSTVAKFLWIDRSAYTYYECSKTLPDLFTLIRLSKFYDIDIKCLILLDGWKYERKPI